MFLGLPDPHPDRLVTSTDPAPDPSIIKQNSKKNLDFFYFMASLFLVFDEVHGLYKFMGYRSSWDTAVHGIQKFSETIVSDIQYRM
jgi:hypothetical protein